ncbi:response regulator [Flavobacterium sp.]|uniref:response regulator n=1 Tax=Flavobacterium sp. TaxID=239 RepID=UPI00286C4E4A|nr:response regulator [Flavobacterium sp.]
MKTSKLLFYLDDDIDDLNYFKHITSGLGHRTEIFMNGNELIYALKHEVEKPDIIFLDVHMPILNGEEILNILKKSEDYKGIPTIMISGAFPKKLARDYQKIGADYLMKKAVGDDLKASLGHVLQLNFPLTA